MKAKDGLAHLIEGDQIDKKETRGTQKDVAEDQTERLMRCLKPRNIVCKYILAAGKILG